MRERVQNRSVLAARGGSMQRRQTRQFEQMPNERMQLTGPVFWRSGVTTVATGPATDPWRSAARGPCGRFPMTSDEYVSLKQLAEVLGMDRSGCRRYLLKEGFKPVKRRTLDSGGQLALSYTKEEADRIISLRRDQGFFGASLAKPISEEKGFFYVIQLVPELDPKRLKLGFASDVADRQQQHRTSAPTATVRKTLPCRKAWELTAIAALTAVGCRLILNEVYECDDLEQLLARGDEFFGMLPEPGWLVPLATCSPLNSPGESDAVEQTDEEPDSEPELDGEAAEPHAPPDRGGR